MKKPLAVASTTALVALATFGIAGAAQASTPIGDAVFYTTADFGAETGAGYPATDWFHGDLGASWTQATVTSSATGLDIVAGPGQAAQILNNESIVLADSADASDFISAISGAVVHASSGDWVFQIPVFGETDSEFTTLHPASLSTTDPAATWVTTAAITDGASNTLYAAGDSDTLGNLVDALLQGAAPEVLAYGFWVGSDSAVSFYSVDVFDELSVFTPIPTRSISPNPITPEQTTTTGLVFSGSGWFPGAEIYIDVYDCDGDSFDDSYDGSAVAGADGTFSVTVTFDEPLPIGTYCYYLDDDDVLYNGDVLTELNNLVVAAAVIEDPASPELAATGAETTPLLVGAMMMLMVGAGALVMSGRMRRRVEG